MSPVFFPCAVTDADTKGYTGSAFILSDVKPVAIHVVVKASSQEQLSSDDMKELIRLAEIYRNAKFMNRHRGIVIDVLVEGNCVENPLSTTCSENMKIFYQQKRAGISAEKSIQAFDKDGNVIFSLQSVNDLFININKQLSRV